MNYVIIEMQTHNGSTAVLTFVETDYNHAISTFLSKASVAALSNIDIHTISILSENGLPVRPSECFKHGVHQEQEEI